MINNVKETLKKLGITITDEDTGRYRPLDDVLTEVAKAFKDFKNRNEKETDKNIIKYRNDLMDEVCFSLAGGDGYRDKIKNVSEIKALLLKL